MVRRLKEVAEITNFPQVRVCLSFLMVKEARCGTLSRTPFLRIWPEISCQLRRKTHKIELLWYIDNMSTSRVIQILVNVIDNLSKPYLTPWNYNYLHAASTNISMSQSFCLTCKGLIFIASRKQKREAKDYKKLSHWVRLLRLERLFTWLTWWLVELARCRFCETLRESGFPGRFWECMWNWSRRLTFPQVVPGPRETFICNVQSSDASKASILTNHFFNAPNHKKLCYWFDTFE